jgi:hypothetical protein
MKLHRTLTQGVVLFTALSVMTIFMTEKVHSEDKPVLTPDYLASNTWDQFNESCVAIKFTKSGQFDMTYVCDNHCEEYKQGSGSYKIKGDTVTLTFEKFPQCTTFSEGETLQGKLKNEDSFGYRWYISFDSVRVYNHNTIIKAGDVVNLYGVDAVSMGSVSGHTTAALKIRKAPGAKEEEITWDGSCDSDNETYKSIKKDTELTIYARTKNKDKVGKLENYWYYVKFYKEGYCGGSVEGWVFGEFVKVE